MEKIKKLEIGWGEGMEEIQVGKNNEFSEKVKEILDASTIECGGEYSSPNIYVIMGESGKILMRIEDQPVTVYFQ